MRQPETIDEVLDLESMSIHDMIAEVEGEPGGLGMTLDEVMLDVVLRMETPEPWIPTGLARIDKYLDGGVRPGEVMLIAARPSVGKSALALQMVLSMLDAGKSVTLWSLEMRPQQWVRRALAALSQVPLGKIRRGELAGYEFTDLNTAMGMLHNKSLRFAPTVLDTRPSSFTSLAQLEVEMFKSDVLVIDYIQLMDPDPEAKSREQEVARASRAIKQVALRLGVPVIALAQLHRNAQNKVPTLADLRESGSLEQDADIVLFIHRHADDETNLLTERSTLILAKNRDGRTGGVAARYDWRSWRFEELAATGE